MVVEASIFYDIVLSLLWFLNFNIFCCAILRQYAITKTASSLRDETIFE